MCLDHLAWIQNTNRFDFQYYAFSEGVRNSDMFTGANTLCPLVEVNDGGKYILFLTVYET